MQRRQLPLLVFAWLLFLSLLLPASLTLGSSSVVHAATVSVTLLPGKLIIDSAPTVLTYIALPSADDTRTFVGGFSIAITDATGSRAGWHVQAALGPAIGPDGAPVPVQTATITTADVTPNTGRVPVSTLAYPRALRTDGETIFSAAAGSGAGKSSLTFNATLSVPASATRMETISTPLDVTIISGP